MTHRDITSDLKDVADLSASGYRILLKISESEQNIRITEIADELSFKFTSVAATVDSLVKKGLVNREEDPDDKRGYNLFVAEPGKKLLKRIDTALLERLKKRWAPLDKQQLEAILVDLDSNHLTSEYVTSIEIPYLLAETTLKKYKLTFTQLLILLQLLVFGNQRPSDIAKALEQKPATISVALSILEEKNLIVRTRSNEDRSEINTEITQQGKDIACEIAADIQEKFEQFTFERYSEKSYRQFNLISKLVVEAATK